MARLRYDFDANGIIEGELVLTYDAAGRVIRESYTYTPDGAPDTNFGSFSIGAAQIPFVSTYEYDMSGRLSRWVTVEGDPASAAGATTTTITYERDADGYVTRQELAMSDGSIPYSLVHSVSPSGPLPTTILIQISAAGAAHDIQRHDLSYDAAGRVSNDSILTIATSSVVSRGYTWRSDGLVSEVTETSGDGSLASTVQLDYDASSRPISRLTTTTGGSAYRWRWDYGALTWTIDLGDNGSVEAVVHTELEAGVCIPTAVWMAGAEPNAPASSSIPVVPGAGYSVSPYCVAS